jgi:dihydropteroate synthase
MPDPMATIGRELEAAANRARGVGIDKTRLVVDPGIGFGKRKEQNSLILARLYSLAPLDLPLLVGPSRKQFLAHATPEQTEFATAAAVAASILGGAHMVRVHNVRGMRAAADIADEILHAESD